jgi:multidrug efflux pump
MNVSALFIRRPVATSLLAVMVLLVGVFRGYFAMPVSSLPQVDFPVIQITTQLPGANPDTVAETITAPLEREIGRIPSIALMSSQSSFGLSQLTVQFDLDRDIDAAAQDVQAAINAAGSALPRNLPYPPIYRKVNPADAPILTLAISSSQTPTRALNDLVDTQLAPQIAEMPGVGRVSIEGGVRPAVRIEADVDRLAARRIGLEDIRSAIVAANFAGSKGMLDGPAQSYTIAANDQLGAVQDYETLVVGYRDGEPILLRDVARIVLGLENVRVGAWHKGHPAIVLNVQKQPGVNIIATVNDILANLPRLRGIAGPEVEIEVVRDRTGAIRAAIEDVKFTLAISVALVILVVFLFLRDLRATIVAGVSLPLSVVATFGVMAACGFSIDNLSLMALTVGAGFVIDDSIVMIENIARRIESGESPLVAALNGSREIGFTVVSLTVSLIAVFIPLLFMTGLVGRMFREFALTLTIMVIVSAAVSLTLTPMMCAQLLRGRRDGRASRIWRLVEIPGLAAARGYGATLRWALGAQPLMILVSAGALVLTIGMGLEAPKGFLPRQDTGLLDVVVDAAPQSSFEVVSQKVDAVARALQSDPDVTDIVSIVGVGATNATTNSGRLSVQLADRGRRRETAEQIAARLRLAAATVPDVVVSIEPVQDLQIASRSSRAQYQYTLVGPDYDQTASALANLADALRAQPIFQNVVMESQSRGRSAYVNVDRETAGRLGVSVLTIEDNLNDAFGQRQISTIYAQSNEYRVVLEADPMRRRGPVELTNFYVSAAGAAQPIPLAALASVRHETAALSLAREGQFPAATLSFDLAPQASLGEAVVAIERTRAELGLPASIVGRFSGDADEFRASLASEPWLILVAVIAVYIVLGVLYESLSHPFTILTTLPSAGVGALAALLATHMEFSLVSAIGVVLLMGIVKKNAIIMIDFAIQAERTGRSSARQAIELACGRRFRPIMMTTFAALLGAVPLALANGAGAELRTPLGVTIIGGLLCSQFVTLYTTPAVYLAVGRLARRVRAAGRETRGPEARS